jgi:CRP-like cAMP-binding protein
MAPRAGCRRDRARSRRFSCAQCLSRPAGIFSELDGERLAALEAAQTSRFVEKGELLYAEGTRLDTLYCVRSGRVKVLKTTGPGEAFILRIAGRGAVLGLESIVTHGLAAASARMLEGGFVCATDAGFVLDLVRKDPGTAGRVIATLARQLLDADEDRWALARLSVRGRIARLLLLFARGDVVPQRAGLPISVGFTRQGLAEIVGAAPETLIRGLAALRGEGIVDTSRGAITILDRRRLLREAHLRDPNPAGRRRPRLP